MFLLESFLTADTKYIRIGIRPINICFTTYYLTLGWTKKHRCGYSYTTFQDICQKGKFLLSSVVILVRELLAHRYNLDDRCSKSIVHSAAAASRQFEELLKVLFIKAHINTGSFISNFP